MGNKYLLEHNEELYNQMEIMLSEKGRALVVLGTGLGKTTTALEYLSRHNCRGLVVVPSNIIKQGWERYGEVDVITYQSFANSYINIDYSVYGVVIYDEVHHGAADTWGNSLRYLLQENPVIPVLGLTATPLRSDGVHVGDELFEGAVVNGLDVLEAVHRGILHKFSYISAYYDAPQVVHDVLEQYINTNEQLIGQLDLALNNTPTVKQILQENMPSGKRKGVIFCYRIDDMDDAEILIREAYPEATIRRLHSNMTDEQIEVNRRWFEDIDEGYLLTVYMMGEGAHYPGVNTIIMLRKTESNLVFQQQLGRCLALTTEVNPHSIVFDLVNNSKNVQNTLQAIRRAVEDLGGEEVARRVKEGHSDGETPYTDQVIVRSYTEELDSVLQRFGPRWTHEEDIYIKNNYATASWEEMMEYLNRPKNQIAWRGQVLGLTRKPIWQEWELQILRDKYPLFGTEIPELKHRSRNTILAQASKMGIKNLNYGSPLFSLEEDEMIRLKYPKLGAKELSKILNRDRGQIERRAAQLQIKSGKGPYAKIWSPEEDALIVQYYANDIERLSALLPNRSLKSLQGRASKLGVKTSKWIVWSEKEIQILKEFGPIEGTDIISRLPGKQKQHIKRKAKQLQITLADRSLKKCIKCVETGIIYPTISKAVKELHCSTIYSCIEGLCETAGGYHWEYVEDAEKN